MGWLDRILGTEAAQPQAAAGGPTRRSETRRVASTPNEPPATDAAALERYRYMVRTAPPEAVEQAHAEAFARLTPEQRRQVLAELANAAPPNERAAAQATSPDDPGAMGRLATRTELRQPGFMERTLGGGGMGLGGSLLGSFAMGFAGSMVAHSFFEAMQGAGDDSATDNHVADDGAEPAVAETDQVDVDDTGGGDFGGDDFGGGDFDI